MQFISLDKVCFIIYKAREFDVKIPPVETEEGSNATDDQMRAVIEDYPDDPTFEELEGALADLNRDEMIEVIALVWLGRGDYDASEWDTAVAEAADRFTSHPVRYLVGMPLLGDYLEEGLAALGFSCQEFEVDRL